MSVTPAALPAHRQVHFSSGAQQAHAARLGMWLFLATEILLFAGLFVAYGLYRHLFPSHFAAASHRLSRLWGTVDTLVLITSSLTMALGIHAVRAGHRRTAVLHVALTVLLGVAFLGLHAHEYAMDLHEGAAPGAFYHSRELPFTGAAMFYTLYFLMTGLHSIHVMAGCSVLSWLGYRTWRGDFSPAYVTPLELGGMYWHLVDSIWIFLYPMLYLV
jgi:cytochrome c oxidase subunit 3